MTISSSEDNNSEASKNILELINVFNVLLNIDEEEQETEEVEEEAVVEEKKDDNTNENEDDEEDLNKTEKEENIQYNKKGIKKDKAASKMTLDEMRAELKSYGQSVKGNRKELSNRLRYFRRSNKRISPIKRDGVAVRGKSKTRYLCFVDFEATCMPGIPFKLDHHEIIEFPAILVDSLDGSTIGTFHKYVKPTLRPVLSNFCKELTNIKQETIDISDDFPTVFKQFNDWISNIIENSAEQISYSDISFVAHGTADFNNFMQSEVSIHKLKRKNGLFKHPVDFIDLRALMYHASKMFNEFTVPNYVTLIGMLRVMELEPEGSAHSGIDDASNLARVAVRLLEQGYDLAPNAKW